MRAKKAKARSDEWIAFEALHNHLQSNLGLQISDYRQLPVGEDPPDFEFQIDGRKLGVEVTRIEDGYRDKAAGYVNFVNSLHDLCVQREVPSNCFTVLFRDFPDIPRPESKKGKKLLNKALELIAEKISHSESGTFRVTAENEGFNENSLYVEDKNPIFIEIFVGVNASTRYVITGSNCTNKKNGQDEPYGRDAVKLLITEACREKVKKLARNHFPISDCVLVLVDEYPLSEDCDVIEDTRLLDEFREFHTVAWIPGWNYRLNSMFAELPGRYCKILWSVNANWIDYPS